MNRGDGVWLFSFCGGRFAAAAKAEEPNPYKSNSGCAAGHTLYASYASYRICYLSHMLVIAYACYRICVLSHMLCYRICCRIAHASLTPCYETRTPAAFFWLSSSTRCYQHACYQHACYRICLLSHMLVIAYACYSICCVYLQLSLTPSYETGTRP